jgi:hypothetical protein
MPPAALIWNYQVDLFIYNPNQLLDAATRKSAMADEGDSRRRGKVSKRFTLQQLPDVEHVQKM